MGNEANPMSGEKHDEKKTNLFFFLNHDHCQMRDSFIHLENRLLVNLS